MIEILSVRITVRLNDNEIEKKIGMIESYEEMELAKKIIQERFGQNAEIDFTFRDLDDKKIKSTK